MILRRRHSKTVSNDTPEESKLMILIAQYKRDLLRRLSRRTFGRFAGLLAAGAALPFYNEPAMAQLSLSYVGEIPEDAVKINANENPLGPCPQAADAIHRVVQKGGRYLYDETFGFVDSRTGKPLHALEFPANLDFAGVWPRQ